MVTAKAGDKKEPARMPRSGHGSASIIPHLRNTSVSEQPEAAEAASVPETGSPQPQGTPAGPPPQAE